MRILGVHVLLAMVALAACSSSSTGATAEKRIEADLHSSGEFGTRVGIAVQFPEARSVSGARLLVGDRVLEASFYPLDGTDPEPPPDPLPLAAGVRASVEASLPSTCDVPRGTPVFVVTSKPDHGRSRDDRYAISNVAEFRRLAQKVCRMGPRLMITGSTERPDGTFTVGLAVTNPGPAATAVSREWTSGRTRGQSARIEVPSGGTAILQIHGTGQGCSHEGPWEHRQVTLDDVVLAPPEEGYADPC